MKEKYRSQSCIPMLLLLWQLSPTASATEALTVGDYTLVAGHPSLEVWSLPKPTHPPANKPTKERITLGKALFFDERLSGSGDMSCATCHIPELGWADGLKTATGANGKKLRRATPTIINTAYNFLHMWDGRFENLESQVLGPLTSEEEMNMPLERLLVFLRNDSQYSQEFTRAYPGEGINTQTLSKAIAAFERTVISADSPFDQWVRGDRSAMSEAQVRGFEVFLNPDKGNCANCHSPPNFSDDGYHNIGLESDEENPDNGRFELVPVRLMKGAFKTPTLRDIESTHPYFHDGSAQTLMDVLNHYASVGDSPGAVSPSLTHAKMTESEQQYMLAFFDALTDKQHMKAQAFGDRQSTLTDSDPTPSQENTKERKKP